MWGSDWAQTIMITLEDITFFDSHLISFTELIINYIMKLIIGSSPAGSQSDYGGKITPTI